MSTSWKKFFVLVCVTLLSACGENSTQTATLPTPANPNNPGTSLPTNPTTGTPGLPDISLSNTITLQDMTNFTGINALLATDNEFVMPPFVVPPQLKMTLANDRSTYVKGKALIWFEDQAGFWGAELKTVDSASVRNSSTIDSIHTDSKFSLRILAAISGTDLYGIIYYRTRQAGENQCLTQTYKCVDQWGREIDPKYCPAYTPPNMAETCRTYMSPSDSNVKQLGTFTAKTSDWFTGAVLP